MVALVGFGLANACSSESKRTAHVLSEGCSVNSDCNAPLVCAFQRCHNACTETRDCPSGERCVASDRPFRVCQLGIEKLCRYNTDCPVSQVCGVDGQCRDQCVASRDCVIGQVCVTGTC